MNALDVEGAQPLFDQVCERRGEGRLLDLVFTLQQIERIGRAGGDLLEDGSGGKGCHLERFEDGADDRPRELGADPLERVDVLL